MFYLECFIWVVLVGVFPLVHPQTGDQQSETGWGQRRLNHQTFRWYIQPFRCDETPGPQKKRLKTCNVCRCKISSWYNAKVVCPPYLLVFLLRHLYTYCHGNFQLIHQHSWRTGVTLCHGNLRVSMGLFRDSEGSWPLSKASFPADGYKQVEFP